MCVYVREGSVIVCEGGRREGRGDSVSNLERAGVAMSVLVVCHSGCEGVV